MINSLPAQIGPIIKQTFGSRTDLHDLSAKEWGVKNARRGDSHPSAGRPPVRSSSQRGYFEPGQGVPGFAVAVFVNALAGRFTQRAAQREVFEVGADHGSQIEGRKHRGARDHIRPAGEGQQQADQADSSRGPEERGGGQRERTGAQIGPGRREEFSQQHAGEIQPRHAGERTIHGGSREFSAASDAPQEQDTGGGGERVQQHVPGRRAARRNERLMDFVGDGVGSGNANRKGRIAPGPRARIVFHRAAPCPPQKQRQHGILGHVAAFADDRLHGPNRLVRDVRVEPAQQRANDAGGVLRRQNVG